jgi:hypothetical protein
MTDSNERVARCVYLDNRNTATFSHLSATADATGAQL